MRYIPEDILEQYFKFVQIFTQTYAEKATGTQLDPVFLSL